MKSGMCSIKFWTGALLMVLNILIWINSLLLHREERGMDVIPALLLLYAGSFLLLAWHMRPGTGKPYKPKRWRFILSLILFNYGVCYLIYIVSDVLYSPSIDLLSMPGILLPILLCLFIVGFILTWEHELYAGVFFLLWYFLVLYGSFKYVEIMSRGPHMQFGIVIFLHGTLYLFYYFRIKPKE
jgi:hypothetical protein